MTFDLSGINWLAVIVAAIVYFALGAVWFAPQTPIGRAWMSASGYTPPTGGAMSGNLFYVFPIVSCLIAVTATAMLARATGTDTLEEGLILGLIVGIGYAAAIMLTTAAFEFSKPNRWLWWVVDASYHVIGLVIAGVILALIR